MRELTPEEKKAKEERKKQIKIRRRKVIITYTLFISLLSGIVTSSFIIPTTQAMLGKENIANEFYNDVIKGDIGWYDSYNNGFLFFMNGTQVSFNDAMAHVYNRGVSAGYSDEEIYIAMSKILSTTSAKEAVGYKPDKEAIKNAAKVSFFEDKIEKINEESNSHAR